MFALDDISGQPRIIAPERAKRLGPRPMGCPFCPGNEHTTPPELDRVPWPVGHLNEAAPRAVTHASEAGEPWRCRAVPNLFPLTDRHEVLILSDHHLTSSRQLTMAGWEAALALIDLRLRHTWAAIGPSHYAHLFVNDGFDAGASLEHTHAQLVAVPRNHETASLTRHTQLVGGQTCQLCGFERTHPNQVRDHNGLVVWASETMLVRISNTPRTTGATIIHPRSHHTGLPARRAEIAHALTIATNSLPEEHHFNLWLVADPTRDAHWYIELVPRIAKLAGVELALGIGVSSEAPLASAAVARDRVARFAAASGVLLS